MNNKVAYKMFHACVQANCSVLRFNFRGVGNSSGEFDNGVGELKDAGSALDWLQNHAEDASSYWVCGFSFGGGIALQLLVRRPEIEGFIVASPALENDQNILSPCPTPGLLMQGTEDDIILEENTYALWQKLNKNQVDKITYKTFQANHMFEGVLDEFQATILQYISQHLRKN